MPQVNIRVTLDGEPLRRARVQYLLFGLPHGEYITDDDGYVRDENGNQGITSVFAAADVRVICQNSVVRVRNGNIPLNPAPVWFDVTEVEDDDDNTPVTIEVTDQGAATENTRDHFRILNSCLEVYDTIYRPFAPFAEMSDPEFPLGKASSLFDTFTRDRRIEVSYPSNFPGPEYSFVEPSGVETGYPLIHFKDDDERLFGDGVPATLIPAEMAHALHFSMLSDADREFIQNDYLSFIITDLMNNGGGTHHANKETTPLVAFLEALDHFSHRFMYFVRLVRDGTIEANKKSLILQLLAGLDHDHDITRRDLRPVRAWLEDLEAGRGNQPPIEKFHVVHTSMYPPAPAPDADLDEIIESFIEHELSIHRTFGPQVGMYDWVEGGTIEPNPNALTELDNNGTSIEGAVYGALYLDFAQRVGLETVLETIFESQELTFGSYREWIGEHQSQLADDLDEVASAWQM